MKKQLAKVFVGEFSAKIFQFLFEFFLVRLLPQSALASWVVFSFVLRFSPYASFGCLSYLNKFYPLETGGPSKQKEIKNGVLQNIIIISSFFVVVSIFFFVLFGFFLHSIYFDLGMSLLVMSLILQYSFFQSLLRNTLRFGYYVIGLLIFCVVQLSVCFFLYQHYNIQGIYYGVVFAYISSIFYYFCITKNDLIYKITLLNIDLMKKGFPPFLLTIVAFLFQSIDRVTLIAYSNEGFLAYYAACFIFYQLGLIIVNTAGKVISPFFLSQIDESKSNVIMLGFLIIFSTLYFVFLMFFLVFGEYFLNVLLSDYAHLYREIFIYMVVGYLVAYSQIYFNELVKRSKEIWAVITTCVFVVFGLVSLVYILFNSNDFYRFVEVSLAINFFYCIAIICLVAKVKKSPRSLVAVMFFFPVIAVSTILFL